MMAALAAGVNDLLECMMCVAGLVDLCGDSHGFS